MRFKESDAPCRQGNRDATGLRVRSEPEADERRHPLLRSDLVMRPGFNA